jgi:hypothetical protein
MRLARKTVKRGTLTAMALVLTVITFRSGMNYMPETDTATRDSVFYSQTIFKAIPGSNTELIGFELHKRVIKSGCESLAEYNVVMRNLDPRTDTYKVYCQDIIKDIVATADEKSGVTINVFDSFEAYSVYEADNDVRQHNTDDLLAAHLVATYEDRTEEDGRYCHLTYYPYSSGYLRETAPCDWM